VVLGRVDGKRVSSVVFHRDSRPRNGVVSDRGGTRSRQRKILRLTRSGRPLATNQPNPRTSRPGISRFASRSVP
jgi:hypothetical protein